MDKPLVDLRGRRGLVFGVANDASIAACRKLGERVATLVKRLNK